MKDKTVIVMNRRDPKGFVMFLNELQTAFDEGWRVPSVEEMSIQDVPGFLNHYAVKVYKGSKTEVKEKEITASILEDKKTPKADLLELANKLEVEIPEDKKAPLAISKYLREVIAKREADIADQEEE